MRKVENVNVIIYNLRTHRYASKEEIQTEIEYRKENLSVDNPKCFGYRTEELEAAIEH